MTRDERKELEKKELQAKYPARKVLLRLLKDTRPILFGLIIATVCVIISVGVALGGSELIGRLTDALNGYYNGKTAVLDFGWITKICMILLVMYVSKFAADICKMIIMNNYVSRLFTASLRIRLSDKIKRLPVSFVDTTPFGEVIARMSHDVSTMGTTIHSVFEMAITGVVQITAIVVLMFMKNPVIAAIVIIVLPISFFIATKVSFLGEKYYAEQRKLSGRMYAHIEEHYGGFGTVKAYNLEKSQESRLEELTKSYRKSGEKSFFISEMVSPLISLSNNLCFVAICIIGGIFAVREILNVGQVVTVILLAKQLAGPIENIASSMNMFQSVLASSRRVYNILDKEEMTFVENPERLPEQKGNVEFRHIAFSYTDAPLITDLSFEAKSGQKIAIVGPTGGGKTTLINLLMRFYDIKSGQILIDGQDIMKVSREELRSRFSMVLQDTWLFEGTIKANVAFGSDDATDEDVVRACDMAYCDHFIRTLPQGYDTVVNNDITTVSAGQKQLLTIARAFLANRPMLILDEATSNVDTRTEILIQKAMDKLMKGRTSFVIAHRLSTIVDADLILVVNNGNIVEQGTHKELLDKKGFYYKLYNSQYALANLLAA